VGKIVLAGRPYFPQTRGKKRIKMFALIMTAFQDLSEIPPGEIVEKHYTVITHRAIYTRGDGE